LAEEEGEGAVSFGYRLLGGRLKDHAFEFDWFMIGEPLNLVNVSLLLVYASD